MKEYAIGDYYWAQIKWSDKIVISICCDDRWTTLGLGDGFGEFDSYLQKDLIIIEKIQPSKLSILL